MSQETHQRTFKGVWIPAEIWDNNDLSWLEKCLWAEINALGTDEKPCFASNAYLSKMLQSTEKNISNMISKMRLKNMIKFLSYDGRTRKIVAIIPTTTPPTSGVRVQSQVESDSTHRWNIDTNIVSKRELPLPPHGEAEDSAMASSSASDSDLISDSVNAANAGIGKANAFDSRPPHQSNSKGCAVRKKSPPKEVDSEFINSLKKLNPRIDVDAELTKMETWLLANPSRQKTRKFVSGWINRCAEKLPPIPKQETFDDIDWANVKPNQ